MAANHNFLRFHVNSRFAENDDYSSEAAIIRFSSQNQRIWLKNEV